MFCLDLSSLTHPPFCRTFYSAGNEDFGRSVFARCVPGNASAMFLVQMIADADYGYFYSIFMT